MGITWSNIYISSPESDHLHIDSKLLAQFCKLNSSSSLDILLTRFSFAKMHKSEKWRNSTMKNLTVKKIQLIFHKQCISDINFKTLAYMVPKIWEVSKAWRKHRRIQTDRRPDKPNGICPPTFCEVGGIKLILDWSYMHPSGPCP